MTAVAKPPVEPTTSNASLIWVIAACRFTEAIAVGMLVPILPLFLSQLDSEAPGLVERWIGNGSDPLTAEQRTAILFSLTGFAMAFIQIVAGRVSDRFDTRKPLILFGLVGGAACSAGFQALETYAGLLGVRVLQGIFMGITFPPLMAIIARHAPEGRGGRALGVYSTIRLFGFAAGPLLGGWISEARGYPDVFFTSAVLLGLSVITVSLWVPEHKDNRQRNSDGTRSALPPVDSDFRILGSALFLMMVGISAMISLFPTYQREFGATERELGFIFSAFLLTRFLLQYPLGIVGDRWDKKWVLIGAMVLLVPVIALQGFVTSLNELLVLRVLLGVSAAAMSVSVNGMAADRSVAGNRARAMGINTFSFSLGVACGPLLTGFVGKPELAFAIPAVATAVMTGIIMIRVPSDRVFQAKRRAVSTPAA